MFTFHGLTPGSVGLQQVPVRVPQQLVLEVLQLPVRQPLLAVFSLIDRPNRASEDLWKDPLPPVIAETWSRGGGQSGALIDHRPAQGGQLIEKGLLNMEVFGHERGI